MLNAIPGVKDSAVVGASQPGSQTRTRAGRARAAPGADLDDIVRQANAGLQDHQKIRAAALWPGSELPRTEGTRKLKRRELKDWLAGAGVGTPAPSSGSPTLRRRR